ncbi:MAG: Maf family nucleotide pyrophosphatase [Burkholderiaceae bacterium]
MTQDRRPPLVLASGSAYRRELLARLRLPFAVDVPHVDETALAAEAPAATAMRLSRLKAETVAARHRDAVVIGSDQVAECDGAPFGKPRTHEAAVVQLRALRGSVVHFHSGLCVVAPDTVAQGVVVTTTVRFRMLGDDDIERYLHTETPYDCAGSAKAEGLGIALLERIDSDDPTALIGLPLIALVSMLITIGYPLFTA